MRVIQRYQMFEPDRDFQEEQGELHVPGRLQAHNGTTLAPHRHESSGLAPEVSNDDPCYWNSFFGERH